MTNMVRITRADCRKIYNIACPEWKKKIEAMAKDAIKPLEDSGFITEEQVYDMFAAANTTQSRTLNEVFPGFKKDKNAFVKSFDQYTTEDISKELFGDGATLQIAVGTAKDLGREDLVGRALYFSHNYKVILHETSAGANVIEIQKK